MLSIKNLLKPIVNESLIDRVYNYSSWKHMYTLLDKTLFNMK